MKIEEERIILMFETKYKRKKKMSDVRKESMNADLNAQPTAREQAVLFFSPGTWLGRRTARLAFEQQSSEGFALRLVL